ncbi:MAG: gliding motility-associated C-terminal domain-containing protein [Bacteroidales bacterium]|nr:gliding motility-associated C-terminal domain-containing protein [Bacteroidales bacterium]
MKLTICISLVFSFLSISTFAQNDFIENKGQWQSNISFKKDLPGGALFLENNQFTFNFYEPKDIDHSHAHDGNTEFNPVKFIHYHSYKVQFLKAKKITPSGNFPATDYINYFIGKDQKRWASRVLHYGDVEYQELYKGIDLRIFQENNSVEYEFHIAPKIHPEQIQMVFSGQDKLYLDETGNLHIKTSINELIEKKPFAYQEIDGEKIPVQCKFKLVKNIVSFNVGKYDKNFPLIIDPSLIFSTYTGSPTDNWGFTATYDHFGNVYSGGISFDVGYPTSVGAYQEIFAGGTGYNPSYYSMGCDVGIIKYSPDGTTRLFATYLGGSTAEELPHSMVVNSENELIVMGTTGSWDFPTSSSAYDNSFNGGDSTAYDNVIIFPQGLDIYVSRFSVDGTQLLGSTYIGGNKNDGFNFRNSYQYHIMHGNDSLYYNYADGARGEVITDDKGNIYVGICTFSSNFPVSGSSFNPTYGGKQDGVVFKLDGSLSYLIWSGYLGGSNDDAIYSLTLDKNQNVFVGGGTTSQDFPTTPGVIYPSFQGGTTDGFIAHISSNGAMLYQSTYFGSPEYDQVYFVRTDKEDNLYATGQTKATGNYWINNALYNHPNSGQFISKLDNGLTQRIWSTAFGTGNGKPNISITAFEVDICHRIFLSGWGREWANHDGYDWTTTEGTKGMDITYNAYQDTTDGQDFYLMVLSEDANFLDYATFFGEIHYNSCSYSGHDHVDGGTSRLDNRGNIYESVCASCGSCDGFPTYPDPGVWSPHNGAAPLSNNCNNAVFRFSFVDDYAIADFNAPPAGCEPYTVTFTNNGQGQSYLWDFGDSTTSTAFSPTHTYTQSGLFYITLIAYDSTTCNLSDTITGVIQVIGNTHDSLPDEYLCVGTSVQIGLNYQTIPGVSYTWTPASYLNNSYLPNPFAFPPSTTEYTLIVDNGICSDTLTQTVHVIDLNNAILNNNLLLCDSISNLQLQTILNDSTNSYIWSSTNQFADTLNGNIHNGNLFVNALNQDTIFFLQTTSPYGCQSIDSVSFIYDPVNINLIGTNDALCYGECSGNASVSGNGQTPIIYEWSNTSSDSTYSDNLCPGNQFVVMTDSIGCTDTLYFQINQPTQIIPQIADTTGTGCGINANTGTATASANGGTPGYTYSWSNGQTSATATGLYANTYVVTITDQNNCDTTTFVTIQDTSQLAIGTMQNNIDCYSNCNGQASAFIQIPSTPPYSYNWSTSDTLASISGLCAGTYYLTLTDANQCYRFATLNIQQPDSIHLNISLSPILCYGYTGGAQITNVSGGTSPFQFYWSTDSTGTSVSGLTADTYHVYAVDSNNCKDTTTFTLQEPPPISSDTSLINQICDNVCNGSIQLIVDGGTPPYSYEWNNGTTTQDVSGLCSGSYDVTITDANGCLFYNSADIQNIGYIPPIDAYSDLTQIFVGQTVSLHGQPYENYQFTWSPISSLSNTHIKNPYATPQETTTYLVTIYDENGCANTDTITIFVMDYDCGEPYIYVPNAFTPNGDGNNDILYVYGGMIDHFYFAIFDRWGELIFETTDIHKGWDGTYKGKLLDPAVFVYHLEATCMNKQVFEKNGNITLIR